MHQEHKSKKAVHKQELPAFESIYVKTETSKRIKRYGHADDSYDTILNKVIDVIEGKRKHSSIIVQDNSILVSRGLTSTDILQQ